MKEQETAGLLNNYKDKEQIEFIKEMISISKKNDLLKKGKNIKLKITAKIKRRVKNKQAYKSQRKNRS